MAETVFKYDVFISYSHKDEEWVRIVLLPALEKQGLKVCIDYRDFIAGKPAIINMADASETSRHTLLVLTPRWVESEWTLYESILSRTDDPTGLQRRTIPLLLEKCNVPKFISMLSWVDFTDKKREKEAWQNLFKSLDKEVEVVEPPTYSPYNTGWFFGHRYGDLATFTGRAAELKTLDIWLANKDESLLMLRALGGFGKSALAWTWFNSIHREQWGTAVWWSFYEKESGFESFLSETLKHLGVEVKASARQQVNDLLEAMRGTNILIVLDGFERLLRQYGRMDAALQSDDEDAEIDPSQRDCSSPLTETFLRGLSGAGMKSKVLMTTRLCPRVLESADGKLLKGCREEALAAFSPEDAVTYFHNEGIKATRAEVIEVCAAYGYHPLSLSLLVGLINKSHEHKGDIVVARNLDIFGDIKIKDKRHHVLEYAYKSLLPERRELLSKISCFRGSMEYVTIKKVFDSPDLESSLIDLRERGLLQYTEKTQRYDMHPIVRHYAYDHLAADKKRESHVQLAKHFSDAMPVTNKNVKTLEDLAPVIELYHHMVRAGNLDEAFVLFRDRLPNALYYQFGAYQLIAELLRALFLDGEDKSPRLKDESAQAWTLNTLANAYSLSGQPRRAVPLFKMTNDIYENKTKYKKHLVIGLLNIAQMAQTYIGALRAAEANVRRGIELAQEIQEELVEASCCQEFGRQLSYRGLWEDTDQELVRAITIQQKLIHVQTEGVSHAYHALRFLLMARENESKVEGQRSQGDNRKSQIENLQPALSNVEASAIQCAQRALELAEERHKNMGHPNVRDYIRAYWLLGSAYLMNNELTLAEENLSKALNLCRQINNVESEADILLDVARLRYAEGDFKDAQEKASEALVITERSGYVLQGADVNLMLAQLALTPAPLPEGEGQGEGRGQSQGEAICRGSVETRHVRRSAVLLQGGV